jgi:hypothetical protein
MARRREIEQEKMHEGKAFGRAEYGYDSMNEVKMSEGKAGKKEDRSMKSDENYKTVQKAKDSYKSRYTDNGGLAPDSMIETKYEKPNFKNGRY